MHTRYIMATVLAVLCNAYSVAQTRTEETRKTVDPAKGDTIVTESVVFTRSEDITPIRNILLVNPLKFFLLYNLSYMHRVSSNLLMGGGFQIPTIAGIDGFGLNAEVRIHPSGKAPRGFYVAPNIGYYRLRAAGFESDPFSIGVLLGWQWFPGDDFAMGLGIGVDYYTGSTAGGNEGLKRYSGSVPAVRFDIGYAW
jgi:hypothetical protein